MHLLLKDNQILNFPTMKIMGILNATPDSFFGESRVPLLEKAMNKAHSDRKSVV